MIPTEWFDCVISGGRPHTHTYLHLYACEDPDGLVIPHPPGLAISTSFLTSPFSLFLTYSWI